MSTYRNILSIASLRIATAFHNRHLLTLAEIQIERYSLDKPESHLTMSEKPHWNLSKNRTLLRTFLQLLMVPAQVHVAYYRYRVLCILYLQDESIYISSEFDFEQFEHIDLTDTI